MPNDQPFTIDTAFQQGVRASHDTPINAQAMVGMRGLRPTVRGAEMLEDITDIGWNLDIALVASRYLHLHKGERTNWFFNFWNVMPFDLDNETFEVGAEIAYNGGFGSSSGWTGANWAVSGGKAVHTAGATTAFTQSSANTLIPPVEFGVYKVTFTISNRTAGSCLVDIGGTNGTSRSANGTYTELIRASSAGTIALEPSSDFDGSIDNLSVTELHALVMDMEECSAPTASTNISNGNFASSGSDWTVDASWTISTAGAVHTPGSTTTLRQALADLATSFTKGEVYRVSWTMTSTAGTLTPKLGSNLGTAREGSGGFEEDLRALVAAGGDAINLDFVPSSDFNGTVTLVVTKLVPRLTWPLSAADATYGQWDVADFGDVLVAARGDMVLARLPYYSNFRWAGFTTEGSTNSTTIRTVAAHQGRLWMGGLASDIFAYGATGSEAARWARLWRVLMDRAMPGAFTHRRLVMDGKTAFISTPSGGDLDYPLIQELAMLGFPIRSGAAVQLDNAALDVAGKGECLVYPLPWKKDIIAVLPLGSGCVYYCGDGISYLEAPPEGGIRHVRIKKLGLARRGAVAGDLLQHTFADQVGRWWRLKADLSLEMLDFKDDLGPAAIDTNLKLTYDAEWGDTYVNAGTLEKGYIISPTGGWAELNTTLVTGVRNDNGLVGVATVRHSDDLFTFETNTFDMGSDWQKIIASVYLSCLDATGVQCAVKYTDDKASATFYTLPYVLLNPSNGVRPNTNGRAFRFLFKGTLGTRTKVERAIIHWRATEKKSTADTTNAVTGYEII
jgi:hypothetical protein